MEKMIKAKPVYAYRYGQWSCEEEKWKKPITRREILQAIRDDKQNQLHGLKISINVYIYGERLHEVKDDALQYLFPLFTYDNARQFNVTGKKHYYWWEESDFSEDGGRMQFLNWLIEQYKDDDTDIMPLIREHGRKLSYAV